MPHPPPARPIHPLTRTCAKCHTIAEHFEFCDVDHAAGLQGPGERRRYWSTETVSSQASRVGHFHYICSRCGYEWTEPLT